MIKNNSLIKECDERNFNSFLEKSYEKYVIFYFNASWCGPCKMLKPFLYKLAEKFENKLIIASVDVEDNMPLARQFNVFSVPTLFLYKNSTLCNSCEINKFDLNSIYSIEKELL